MHPLLIAAVLIPLGVLLLVFAVKSGPPVVEEVDDEDILDESQEAADESNIPKITSLPAPPPTMMMSAVRPPVAAKPATKPVATKPKKGDSDFVPVLRDAVKQAANTSSRSVGKLAPIGR